MDRRKTGRRTKWREIWFSWETNVEIARNKKLKIAVFGDREIIGSTPKNPVNKRDGWWSRIWHFSINSLFGSREASDDHRKSRKVEQVSWKFYFDPQKKKTGNLTGGKSNALVRSRPHIGLFDVLKEFIDRIGIVTTINSESDIKEQMVVLRKYSLLNVTFWI